MAFDRTLRTPRAPQDLLVNCVVEPPGYLPVTGEVQIHLLDTIILKERTAHKFYEITRASSAAVFLAEAKGKEHSSSHQRAVEKCHASALSEKAETAAIEQQQPSSMPVAPSPREKANVVTEETLKSQSCVWCEAPLELSVEC